MEDYENDFQELLSYQKEKSISKASPDASRKVNKLKLDAFVGDSVGSSTLGRKAKLDIDRFEYNPKSIREKFQNMAQKSDKSSDQKAEKVYPTSNIRAKFEEIAALAASNSRSPASKPKDHERLSSKAKQLREKFEEAAKIASNNNLAGSTDFLSKSSGWHSATTGRKSTHSTVDRPGSVWSSLARNSGSLNDIRRQRSKTDVQISPSMTRAKFEAIAKDSSMNTTGRDSPATDTIGRYSKIKSNPSYHPPVFATVGRNSNSNSPALSRSRVGKQNANQNSVVEIVSLFNEEAKNSPTLTHLKGISKESPKLNNRENYGAPSLTFGNEKTASSNQKSMDSSVQAAKSSQQESVSSAISDEAPSYISFPETKENVSSPMKSPSVTLAQKELSNGRKNSPVSSPSLSRNTNTAKRDYISKYSIEPSLARSKFEQAAKQSQSDLDKASTKSFQTKKIGLTERKEISAATKTVTSDLKIDLTKKSDSNGYAKLLSPTLTRKSAPRKPDLPQQISTSKFEAQIPKLSSEVKIEPEWMRQLKEQKTADGKHDDRHEPEDRESNWLLTLDPTALSKSRETGLQK